MTAPSNLIQRKRLPVNSAILLLYELLGEGVSHKTIMLHINSQYGTVESLSYKEIAKIYHALKS